MLFTRPPKAQVPDQTSDASIASVVEPEAELESECEVVTAVEVEYPPEMNPAAVVIQTTWRGFMTRKRYVEEKTTRQWVAIKVQSLFRAIKARRVFAKHARCVSQYTEAYCSSPGLRVSSYKAPRHSTPSS